MEERRRDSEKQLERASQEARSVISHAASEARAVISEATAKAIKVSESHEVDIHVLTERVNNWMAETTDYRKSLCGKLDVLLGRMNELPCKQGRAESEAQGKEIGWLQKGATVIICSLFGMGVWTGNINTTTNSHEKRINNLETIEQEAQKIRSTNVANIAELQKVVVLGKSNRV